MNIIRWLYGRSIVSVQVIKINNVYRDFLGCKVNATVKFQHNDVTKTCNTIISGEPKEDAILYNFLVANRDPDYCRQERVFTFIAAAACLAFMVLCLDDARRYHRHDYHESIKMCVDAGVLFIGGVGLLALV